MASDAPKRGRPAGLGNGVDIVRVCMPACAAQFWRGAVINILGFDSGLASFGWCQATLSSDGVLTFLGVGVWKTAPNPEAFARKADDVSARCRWIYKNLRGLAHEHRPNVITVESLAFPQGRVQWSVISGLGRARALVDALATEVDADLFERMPQELKRSTTGSVSGTKDQVRASLEDRYPELRSLWPTQKTLLEHAGDACASVHASLHLIRNRRDPWT
ncbi:MAG: crossover junction endodeoxyribonuclease RuvC [Phycisphaerales bacterium]